MPGVGFDRPDEALSLTSSSTPSAYSVLAPETNTSLTARPTQTSGTGGPSPTSRRPLSDSAVNSRRACSGFRGANANPTLLPASRPAIG